MAAARAPADDAAPRCFKVPEMRTQPRRPSGLSACVPPLVQRLRRSWRSLLRPAQAAATRAPRPRDVLLDVEAEPPGACGWFDSSHELVHGLQVQELTSPESQAAALPLATWLQLQLEGCGGVRPA